RLGSYPRYFLRLRERNRRGPDLYGTPQPELDRLDVNTVLRLMDDGDQIVDVRPVPAFAAGHVPGSLSIPLRPQFASWLGWLLADDVPLVFVRDPTQDPTDVVRQALGIGYERLAGELDGGVPPWKDAGLPLMQLPLVVACAVSGA